MSRSSWPFFAHQCHRRTCCGSLSAQTLGTHAFSVFKLVGLCRHPGGTVVPPITLVRLGGSSPDHSSPPCQLLDDPSSFLVFVRTEPPPHLRPPDRGHAETDLERAGMFVIYVLVGAVCQKCQQRQFLEDNETLLLADVCPSNTKTLPAKNCVSQTRPPYRG